MSLRLTGVTGEQIQRTASPPSTTTFTEMLWVYITTDRNAVTLITYRNNAGDTVFLNLGMAADGTTLFIQNNGASLSGSALSVGTWYHVALVKSGSSHLVYLNGVQDISFSNATDISLAVIWYIASVSGFAANNLDGRVAAYKIWDGVALTVDEVKAEVWSYVPKRTANLYAWLPMVDPVVAQNVFDYSGAARPWSITGTLSVESGPPIAWGPQRQRHVRRRDIVRSAPEIFLYPGEA